MKNRILRIYPLFLIGFLLSILTLKLILNETLSFAVLSGNFFLLASFQSFIVPVIKTNPVVWSLTYELFFYIVFAISILRFQQRGILIWFIFSLLSMPFYYFNYTGLAGHLIAMLSFSSIWLLGYYIYEYRSFVKVPDLITVIFFAALLPGISRLNFSENYYDVVKYFVFSVFTIPLFLYCLNSKPISSSPKFALNATHKILSLILLIVLVMSFSSSLFINKIIYIVIPAIPLLFSLAVPSEKFVFKLNFLKVPAIFFGKISYAVYIIHFPIILLLNYYFPVRVNLLSILLTIIIVVTSSWFLEKYIQPSLVKVFKK